MRDKIFDTHIGDMKRNNAVTLPVVQKKLKKLRPYLYLYTEKDAETYPLKPTMLPAQSYQRKRSNRQ
jgi:hypothetical protein